MVGEQFSITVSAKCGAVEFISGENYNYSQYIFLSKNETKYLVASYTIKM